MAIGSSDGSLVSQLMQAVRWAHDSYGWWGVVFMLAIGWIVTVAVYVCRQAWRIRRPWQTREERNQAFRQQLKQDYKEMLEPLVGRMDAMERHQFDMGDKLDKFGRSLAFVHGVVSRIGGQD